MEIIASHTAMQNITGDYELEIEELDYVVQPITSSVIITYLDNVSTKQIEEDQKKMLEYGVGTTVTLDELHENSIDYLLEEAKMFFPIIIILFILTSVSSISTSALITRKSLKNYALYYINGLEWRHCAIVNLLHSIFSLVLAVVLGFLALFLILYTRFADSVEIIWSGYIVLAFAVLILLEMLISMIIPLRIIGKNTPKQILTR
ncbi:MAG: hypothetical protein LUF89_08600 [Ruminococcus sp.]|nr:hypothetical protein [Ruminococcus sp.]